MKSRSLQKIKAQTGFNVYLFQQKICFNYLALSTDILKSNKSIVFLKICRSIEIDQLLFNSLKSIIILKDI